MNNPEATGSLLTGSEFASSITLQWCLQTLWIEKFLPFPCSCSFAVFCSLFPPFLPTVPSPPPPPLSLSQPLFLPFSSFFSSVWDTFTCSPFTREEIAAASAKRFFDGAAKMFKGTATFCMLKSVTDLSLGEVQKKNWSTKCCGDPSSSFRFLEIGLQWLISHLCLSCR